VSAVPVDAISGLVRATRVLERASGELSLSQYRVLASIASGDERASRIADRLALGRPTISATVETLRQRGLLTRNGVDEDLRAAALRLTDDGRAALDAAERAMLERLGWLADRTPDPAALLRALAWLDDAVDDYLHQRADAGERR
jgi:DNA-binding MarR family transcriptional regulator